MDRANFKQGNTWLVCQINDVAVRDYDGPLMQGMHIMFQHKSRTVAFRGGHTYGVDQWVMRIDKLDGSTGDFVGTILRALEIVQDEDDEEGCMSEEDELVNIPNVEGRILLDNLHVAYPSHRRGVNHVYSRIGNEKLFDFAVMDEKGLIVEKED